MCFGGVFVATSEKFFAFSPEIPEEKGFFSCKPGHPAVTAQCDYSEVLSFSMSSSIHFPIDALLHIRIHYPKNYQSPYPHDLSSILKDAYEKTEDPSCSGFAIESAIGDSIYLAQLPESWLDLRSWEKLLRFTLGIIRDRSESNFGA